MDTSAAALCYIVSAIVRHMEYLFSKRIFLGLIFLALTVGIGTFFRYSAPTKDACLALQSPEREWCFVRASDAKAMEEGIPAALAYVRDIVKPNTNYKVAHMAMHMVGHHAYMHDDLGTAHSYLPAEDAAIDEFLDFNGYLHGVFEAFFVDQKERPVLDLMHEACADYYTSSPGVSRPESILGPECFHAVGHALMFIGGNDVPESLVRCDLLPHPWMRLWCYHGVFMENHYLHISGYMPDAPRPFATGDAALRMCHALERKYQSACSQFVGWIHIEIHPEDFAGAFDACGKFDGTDARICIARTARFQIATPKHDTDFIIRTCSGPGVHEDACLYGAGVGISEGIAGFSAQQRDFCALVAERFQNGCAEAVARSKESLARIYVTEL